MIGRRIGAVTGALAVVLAASTVVATPAHAASCNVQIGYTYRSANRIWGFGSLSDCPSSATATVSIQWERALNIWQYLSNQTVNGPGYDQYVSFNCEGTGTHNFRTIIRRYPAGGPQVKTSDVIRVSC
jgi:hypothetical protein